MTTDTMGVIQVGDAALQLEIRDNSLHSIGAVTVGGAALRNPATRFLPWFDNSTRFPSTTFAVDPFPPRAPARLGRPFSRLTVLRVDP